jgi:hypothetical protein
MLALLPIFGLCLSVALAIRGREILRVEVKIL